MIQILVHLKMSQRLLKLFSRLGFCFLGFFFNSCFFLLFCLNAYLFLMFQIIDLFPSSSPSLLVPYRFFFISLSEGGVSFISSFMFLLYSVSSLSILIKVFWTLHLMGWLSPFHLVLFLGFCSVLTFGPYFFVSSIWQPPLCLCLY